MVQKVVFEYNLELVVQKVRILRLLLVSQLQVKMDFDN